MPRLTLLLAAAAACTLALLTAPASGGNRTLVALVNATSPDNGWYAGHSCGGVLVAADRVLTAAHCMSGRQPADVAVVSGTDDLCRPEPDAARHEVVDAVRVGADNLDAVLLTLAAAVSEAPAVVPSTRHVGAGQGMVAVGWGRTSVGGVPTCTARSVRLRSAPDSDCMQAASSAGRQFDPGRQLCLRPTPGAPVNTCTGDSGSPVFDEAGRLAAIVSWGPDCDPTSVGVYTRSAAVLGDMAQT